MVAVWWKSITLVLILITQHGKWGVGAMPLAGRMMISSCKINMWIGYDILCVGTGCGEGAWDCSHRSVAVRTQVFLPLWMDAMLIDGGTEFRSCGWVGTEGKVKLLEWFWTKGCLMNRISQISVLRGNRPDCCVIFHGLTKWLMVVRSSAFKPARWVGMWVGVMVWNYYGLRGIGC